MRGEGREREKSAVVGHHLLEKASLPWRVILGAVGRCWKKKTAGSPDTHMRIRTHTYSSLCSRHEIFYGAVARDTCQRTVQEQVIQAEGEERTRAGCQVGHNVFFFFLYKAPGSSWSGENAEKMFGVVSHVDTVKVSTTIKSSLLHLVVWVDTLIRKLLIDCLIKNSISEIQVLCHYVM